MIVVDASALLEVLLRTPAAAAVEERLFAPHQTLHAPHLLDLETAQVVRRYAMNREISSERGREALIDFRSGATGTIFFCRGSGNCATT